MTEKKEKPIAIRLTNTLCAFLLIGTAIYVAFAGITLIPSLLFLSALGGLAAPVVVGGSEGSLECFMGILEAFVDGIAAFFEAIGEIFGSIFG